MPRMFFSTEQYFPGWNNCPVLFAEGATWSPYSMAVHRDSDSVLHENIWMQAGNGGLQLEFPWGMNYDAIQVGEQIYSRIAG